MPNGSLEDIRNLGIFNLPIDEDLLLKAVISAQNRGYIRTNFKRIVVSAPLGTTTTQIITPPEGRVLKYIATDRIYTDIHDKDLKVSLTIDGVHTVYNQVPLTRDISVDSIYFPYVQNEIKHTIINNGAYTAEFTEDAELLSIDKSFFDQVLNPLFTGQFDAIRDFANKVGAL